MVGSAEKLFGNYYENKPAKSFSVRFACGSNCRHDTQYAEPEMSIHQEAMDLEIARSEARPFLKWVGGKSQLLDQFDEFFPNHIDRYVEPFIGGGAVFFHLKHRFPKMRSVLRDINPELINCYTCISMDWVLNVLPSITATILLI